MKPKREFDSLAMGLSRLDSHAECLPARGQTGRGVEQIRELAGLKYFRQIHSVLRDEQTSTEQFDAYRRMTPERRLALAEQLYWVAREWKAAGLRVQHPDWSEKQVAREVTRIFLHART